MAMEVRCTTPCYEVWFSSVPDFSSYQTQIVSNTSLPLPPVQTVAYARVRALQNSEVSGEVARSAWSNAVPWGEAAATAVTVANTVTQTVPSTVTLTQTVPTTRTATTATFTVTTVTVTTTTLPPGLPTTMQPVWFLPESQLPGSDDGVDGVEATLSFTVPPGAVQGFADGTALQPLQASVSSMLQVQTGEIKVLAVRAAEILVGTRAKPRSGAMQADFVVLCEDAKARQSATAVIEDSVFKLSPGQRFTTAMQALHGVEAKDVQLSMVDREWSRAMQSNTGSNSVVSVVSGSTHGHGPMGHSLFGLHHLTWAAAGAAVLVSCVTCYYCSRSDDPAVETESVPFLSPHSDSDLPEKGAVPPSVLGFDPRHFDAEKYKHRPAR